jgi:hypothetical protein
MQPTPYTFTSRIPTARTIRRIMREERMLFVMVDATRVSVQRLTRKLRRTRRFPRGWRTYVCVWYLPGRAALEWKRQDIVKTMSEAAEWFAPASLDRGLLPEASHG